MNSEIHQNRYVMADGRSIEVDTELRYLGDHPERKFMGGQTFTFRGFADMKEVHRVLGNLLASIEPPAATPPPQGGQW